MHFLDPGSLKVLAVRVRMFKCTEPRGSTDTIQGNFMLVETHKTNPNNPEAAQGEYVDLAKIARANPVLMAKMTNHGLPLANTYYGMLMQGLYEYE
jgi:hypothetical protein